MSELNCAEVFDDFEYYEGESDTTAWIVYREIRSSLLNPYHIRYQPSKEKFDLWQRLLIVLKSGAELTEDFRRTPRGYGPFLNLTDIRNAKKMSGDYSKKKYHKIGWKPYTPKPGCGYIDVRKQKVIIAILAGMILFADCYLKCLSISLMILILFLAEKDPYNKTEITDKFGNSNYIAVFKTNTI
ncbi:MAG: hypothetical protein LWY06_00830 [Firmicutes bacterium]|nr:hypothetical protein [Bacillota bacterium]